MICLLDTNVISQQTVDRPHEGAIRFLETLPQEEAYLSVINLMEIRDGIERLPPTSQKRDRLERWITLKLPEAFSGRLLQVTAEIAEMAGRMLAAERDNKRTPDKADILLAATAKHYGMRLATLNQKHFHAFGIPLIEL